MGKGQVIGSAYLQIIPKLAFGNVKKESAIAGNTSSSAFNKTFGDGLKSIGSIAKTALKGVAVASGAAAAAAGVVGKQAFDAYANFEQLSGGVEKIFDKANISQIMQDAQGAYADLNMSANQYLESINQVGATFAQTMGDQKGYDTAREGMKAIADFASGTGKNLDELNDKYAMITRSTSSYQSIADQFAGILPQTNKDFLEQAQAAGFLSDSYKKLTDVPVAEYQSAVTKMLSKGVKDMGLMNNTLNESMTTISGSLAMARSAWENVLTAIGTGDSAQLTTAANNLVDSFFGAVNEASGKREGGVIANIVAFAQRAATALGEALPGLFQTAMDALPKDVSGPLQTMFSNIAKTAKAVYPPVVSAISAITSAIGTIAPVVAPLLPIIAGALGAIKIVGVITSIITAITGIVGAVGSFVAAATTAITMIQTIPGLIAVVTTAMGGPVTIIAAIVGAIVAFIATNEEARTAVVNAWNSIKEGVSNAMATIKAVVPAAAASMASGARNKFAALVSYASTTFSKVKNAITTPINAARDAVSSAIERIKSIVNGAHLSLPHFALPHFRIDGGELPWGIGGKGHAPSVHVDWYAKGGWIDSPTIFAGVGERGGEFVWPSYAPYLDQYADALASRINGGGGVNVYLTYNGSGDADELVRTLTRDLRMMRMTGAI